MRRQLGLGVALLLGVSVASSRAGRPAAEPAARKPELVLQYRRTGTGALAFSPDGQTLASAGMGGVRLLDARTGAVRRVLPAPGASLKDPVISADGRILHALDASEFAVRFWELPSGRPLERLNSVPELRHPLALSPDGRLLAATAGTLADGGSPLRVAFRNTATGEIERTLPEGNARFGLLHLQFSPDGSLLATRGRQGELELWNLGTGKARLLQAYPEGDVAALRFSSDGRRLMTLGRGMDINRDFHRVKVWDPHTGELLSSLSLGNELVGLCQDGRTVAVTSPGVLQLWDTARGEKLRDLPAAGCRFGPPSFSPDGSRVAWNDWRVSVWETASGNLVWSSPGASRRQPVLTMSFTRAGLYTQASGAPLQLWSARTGRPEVAAGDSGSVYPPMTFFSPDGRVAAQLRGIEVVLRSAGDLREIRRFPVQPGIGDGALVVSPDAKTVATLSGRGGSFHMAPTVSIWKADFRPKTGFGELPPPEATGRPPGPGLGGLSFHSGAALTVAGVAAAFSWDRKRVAIARADGEGVDVIDTATLATRRRLPHHGNPPGSVAFSPDGSVVVAAGDYRLDAWDLRTGSSRWGMHDNVASGARLLFFPDGRHVAVVGSLAIEIRDAATGALRRTLAAEDATFSAAAVSADGATLAVGRDDGGLELWDANSGQRRITQVWLAEGTPVDPPSPRPEWIAYTPDRRYATSPGGEAYMRWRVGDLLEPASRFRPRFARPDLLRDALAGASPSEPPKRGRSGRRGPG
jgi:WD40 repeat protein